MNCESKCSCLLISSSLQSFLLHFNINTFDITLPVKIVSSLSSLLEVTVLFKYHIDKNLIQLDPQKTGFLYTRAAVLAK